MEIPYLEYFGFREKPFGMSPDPEFYFESKAHKQAFDCLTFFIAQQEGFALIHGDVGSGKTTISRIFLNSIKKESFNTALLLNPLTDETELIKEILREFGVIYKETNVRKELYDTLRLFLLNEFKKGKENVLIIDEAQLLSYELLEFIRLLSNIETDKQKILHTIFFAQPEFLNKLKDPRLRHLTQRITVSYGIEPISYNETKSYINYRLFTAGSKGPLVFQDGAIKLIHRASKGYPRLINYICDRCLLLLYAQTGCIVNGGVVSRVFLEENIPLNSVKNAKRNRIFQQPSKVFLTGLMIILIFVFTGMIIYQAKKGAFILDAHTGFLIKQPTGAPHNNENNKVTRQGVPGWNIAEKPSASLSKMVSVSTDAANVRIEPNIRSTRIATIMKGESLRVTKEEKDRDNLKWYKVLLYEGREGWIASTLVTDND